MLAELYRMKEACEVYASQGWQSLNTFVLDNPFITMIWSGALAIILVIVISRMIDRRKPKQGFEDMAKQAELDKIYADKIHDFLFDMLHRGEIDKKQYRRDLERFGQKFRLTDIIRVRTPKVFIRIRVKQNVKMMRTLTAKTKPDAFPGGPRPIQELPPPVPTTPVAVKRKVFLVVAKRRERTT